MVSQAQRILFRNYCLNQTRYYLKVCSTKLIALTNFYLAVKPKKRGHSFVLPSCKKLLLVGPFYQEFFSVFCNAAFCVMLPLNTHAVTKF